MVVKYEYIPSGVYQQIALAVALTVSSAVPVSGLSERMVKFLEDGGIRGRIESELRKTYKGDCERVIKRDRKALNYEQIVPEEGHPLGIPEPQLTLRELVLQVKRTPYEFGRPDSITKEYWTRPGVKNGWQDRIHNRFLRQQSKR